MIVTRRLDAAQIGKRSRARVHLVTCSLTDTPGASHSGPEAMGVAVRLARPNERRTRCY